MASIRGKGNATGHAPEPRVISEPATMYELSKENERRELERMERLMFSEVAVVPAQDKAKKTK